MGVALSVRWPCMQDAFKRLRQQHVWCCFSTPMWQILTDLIVDTLCNFYHIWVFHNVNPPAHTALAQDIIITAQVQARFLLAVASSVTEGTGPSLCSSVASQAPGALQGVLGVPLVRGRQRLCTHSMRSVAAGFSSKSNSPLLALIHVCSTCLSSCLWCSVLAPNCTCCLSIDIGVARHMCLLIQPSPNSVFGRPPVSPSQPLPLPLRRR